MKKPLVIATTAIVALAITIVSLRMISAPVYLTLVPDYQLSTFPDISQFVVPHNDIKQAIAIDGILAYSDHSPAQPTASTAKMLTALMVMEKQPFHLGETGSTIEITDEFYEQYLWYVENGGSNAAVTVGEQISEYDALAAALLPSSNNFADALAIWAFGSLEDYHDYATTRLAEWGLTDTTIGIDASGFSETTTSTAADLAIIGQKLMENPVLAEIVGLTSHTIPIAGQIDNTNQLLGIDGVVGIKTGYIGEPSGYCLVSAYRLNDHIITLSVLNAPTRADSFNTSQEIIESLQTSFTESTAIHAGDAVGYYESWWAGQTPIVASTDLTILGWQGADPSINLTMTADEGSNTTPITTNGDSSPTSTAATDKNPDVSIATIDDSTLADPTTGTFTLHLGTYDYSIPVTAHDLQPAPTLWQRFLYAIGLL